MVCKSFHCMHPILFRIGNFEIHTFGVMLAIAFAVGLWVAMKRAQWFGISPEKISDLAILLLEAGVVGSRLLFVLEEWQDYEGHFFEIFNLRQGGLSISGGLILAFFAGLWFVWKNKLDFWKTADVLAPALALGMGLGRIGCFFNGCCVGTPSHLPWAFVFPANPRYFGPRHPTQLYEMILDLSIAALLLLAFKKAKPGVAFLWCAILVSFARFLVEFLRADAIPVGPLSLVQWICLATILVAAFFLVKLQSHKEKARQEVHSAA
jgi:phosphatidylglycerol:prolipoprotein diacylglycerol transferase